MVDGERLTSAAKSIWHGVRPAGVKAAQIIRPADFAYVGGVVDVRGRINGRPAADVQLAYGQGVNPRQWADIDLRPADDGSGAVSGRWDTAALSGVYTLKLTAVFDDGSSDVDTRLVTLDNTAPSIEIRTSDAVEAIEYPAQTVVSLVADASDNLTIARVEFYHNDELLGIDREWPYGFEYDIAGVGAEVFRARVFDQVGNSAASDITVQIVRSP